MAKIVILSGRSKRLKSLDECPGAPWHGRRLLPWPRRRDRFALWLAAAVAAGTAIGAALPL